MVIPSLRILPYVRLRDTLRVHGLLIQKVLEEPLIITVDQALLEVMVLMMLRMHHDLSQLSLLDHTCQEYELVSSVCLLGRL